MNQLEVAPQLDLLVSCVACGREKTEVGGGGMRGSEPARGGTTARSLSCLVLSADERREVEGGGDGENELTGRVDLSLVRAVGILRVKWIG